MKISYAKLGVVLFILIGFVMAGCGSDSDSLSAVHADAAANGNAQVRVGCMLFPLADFQMDGGGLFENMVYPYISDYQAVGAGDHMFRAIAAGDADGPEASLDVTLEADHRYLIVSYGNIATQSDHALLLVDETEAVAGLTEEGGSLLFLHLLNGAPGLDGYVNGEQQVENLTYGTAAFLEIPIREFQVAITPAGMQDMVLYEAEYTGLPQTHTVVTMSGSPLNPNLYTSVYTPLDMLSFFNHLADIGEYYDETRTLLTASNVIDELAGPGPLTVFAPWDSVYIDPTFRDVPDVRDDPARLADAMRYYIVPENVPPYVLYHRTSLPTLQGTPLQVSDGLWLNGAAHVYQDYRVSNGVLYELEGLLTPFGE